ncbi:hypothetical protein GCM10027406_09510 [Leifsonia lichenia]
MTTIRTAAVFAIAVVLTLGGCAMTAPADTTPQKTGQQLRAQIIDLANAGIAASGLPDGWTYGTKPNVRAWNPEAKEFLGASCSTANGESRQLFLVQLFHTPVGDPVAFVDMMGDYWTEQGYIVSTVVPTITTPGGRNYTQIRADRPDGSLAAGLSAQDTLFAITFYSECSTDPSLDMFAGPTGYREFDEQDPDPYHPTNTPTITPYPDH